MADTATNGTSSSSKPKKRTRASGTAIVKAVVSGDSLVLIGKANPGQLPPEKNVTISGIIAPKFARGRKAQDEPWAWHAREFLRKKCVGKKVKFSVNYHHEASGREYVDLVLDQTQENLAHSIIQKGWAQIKGTGKKGDGKIPPERANLVELQNDAQSLGLGKWRKVSNNKELIREVDWYADARALFQKSKGIKLPAIVDQVRDGSTLRCEILDPAGGLNHTMITLFLSGIQSVRTPLPFDYRRQQYQKKLSENPDLEEEAPKEEAAAPFALEAQFFTEARLLHREVKVLIQGVDKFNNFFGTVIFHKGNIGMKLLEMGFAKMIPWSAALTPDYDKIKAAQELAKAKKLVSGRTTCRPHTTKSLRDNQSTAR
jgi:staphylococcal nuclease domain-containing protein 1